MTELAQMHSHTPEAHEEIHVPGPSIAPLLASGGALCLAYSVISSSLPLLGLGVASIFIGVVAWLWGNLTIHAPDMGVELPKMAMWLFIGTEVMFFTALIVNYLVMRAAAPPGYNHLLNIPVTAVNTFVLLTSSLTVVLALDAAQRDDRKRLVFWLLGTIVLGTLFVSVQAYEYTKLIEEGFTLDANRFGTAFFVLTGFHGSHVTIGVLWCLAVFMRARRGGFTATRWLGVEIFGLYWHFVDIVWILLFVLIYLI